ELVVVAIGPAVLARAAACADAACRGRNVVRRAGLQASAAFGRVVEDVGLAAVLQLVDVAVLEAGLAAAGALPDRARGDGNVVRRARAAAASARRRARRDVRAGARAARRARGACVP